MSRHGLLRSLLVLILALARPWLAVGAAPTCGAVLTRSTKLVADLACPTGGLIAGADGITIDLGGFTLSGTGATDSVGINADGHTRVTIRNGTVRGFWIGVSSGANFADAPKMKLSHLVSRVNMARGGEIQSTGVAIADSAFLANATDGLVVVGRGKVSRTAFTGNAGFGLAAAGEHLVLSRLAATVNQGDGIKCAMATGITVTQSTIAGNAGRGVLFDHVDGSRLVKSVITGNDGNGVEIDAQAANGANVVDKNLIAGNSSGVGILGANGTVVTNNRLIGNAADGVAVDGQSENTVVRGNTAIGHGEDGFVIVNATTALTRNVANANFGDFLIVTTAVDGGGNTARGNAVSATPCETSITCPSPFTSKPGGAVPTCGMHVTENLLLAADTPVCTGSGLIVDADGVTIDLNGHTVQGDQSADHVGIDAQDHAGVTIRNGVVSSFDRGIASTGRSLALLDVVARANVVYGAILTGEKAVVRDSAFVESTGSGLKVNGSKPKVTNSFFVGNGGSGVVAESTGGTFTNLTTTGNAGHGFAFSDGGKSQLKNAIATTNSDGVAILAAPTSELTVAKSLLVGNHTAGLSAMTVGARVTLTGNTAAANGNGIAIIMSNLPFTVTKNTAVGNRANGMFFGEAATIVASRNTALGNRGDGIATDAATVTLAKNVADANLKAGIVPLPPGATDGGGNEAHANIQGSCAAPVTCKSPLPFEAVPELGL